MLTHGGKFMVELDQEVLACMELWLAKLTVHLKDIRKLRKENPHRQYAERWVFVEDSYTTGGFVWICVLFNMDVDRVRSAINPQWREQYASQRMAVKTASPKTLQKRQHAAPMGQKDRLSLEYR
jgi:hypothetical protein